MKSPFQTILVVVFAALFVAAVVIFSGLVPIGSKKQAATPQGNVVMWGIAPQTMMQSYLDSINAANVEYSISYREHDPQTLAQDLIVALANGTQPDLILFSSEQLNQIKNRLYPIPYTTYTERAYRDANIDGAQVFLSKNGILATPLVVDPLVVYYNKDLLAQASVVVPPKTWANLQQLIPLFTKRDARNNLIQSTIALGTSANVAHMKDILAALFFQTGNAIVSYDATTDTNMVVLGSTPAGATSAPAAQALRFYTSFANPTSSNYSWTTAFPDSLTQFLSGKSVFYIGRASELFTIQSQNPNLNFDVIQIFQTGAATRPVTFGSFVGVGILKNAPNFTAAYAAASLLSQQQSVDTFSKTVSLPPVRRDLLLVQQTNPYVATFFSAALSAFAWSDPDPFQTTSIFKDAVTGVLSGRVDPDGAIFDIVKRLQSLVQ